MACCMFAAFIVGHIVLMWQSINARFFPERAKAMAARAGASAWRPGMTAPATPPAMVSASKSPLLIRRMAGVALILISATYFSVQAKAAYVSASDARTFAVLLAQNICRVTPAAAAKAPLQVAAAPIANQK